MKEALTRNQETSVREVGKTVSPAPNLVSKLLYLRSCVRETTCGENVLFASEKGERSVQFWNRIKWYDFIFHYADFALLIAFCLTGARSPTVSFDISFLYWLFMVGPVIIHIYVMIYVVLTLGMGISGVLRFALFFHAKTSDKIGERGNVNTFIDISAKDRLTYSATDEQTFFLGMVIQKKATISFMIYNDTWKALYLNYQGYANNFVHIVIVFEIICGAALGYSANTDYLAVYCVWFFFYWLMMCYPRCANDDDARCWYSLGLCLQCITNIILCPVFAFNLCFVEPKERIKERLQAQWGKAPKLGFID